MKAIAEYFRDLAADDRYFGAEPPTPDAEMLARIAEKEIARRVEAHETAGQIYLRAEEAPALNDALVVNEPAAEEPAEDTPVEDAPSMGDMQPDAFDESVAPVTAEADDEPVVEQDTDDDMIATSVESAIAEATQAPQADEAVEAEDIVAPESAFQPEPQEESVHDASDSEGENPEDDDDSVAARLRRIRSVVARGHSELAGAGFLEDEHAQDFLGDTVSDLDAALVSEPAMSDPMPELETSEVIDALDEEEEYEDALLDTHEDDHADTLADIAEHLTDDDEFEDEATEIDGLAEETLTQILTDATPEDIDPVVTDTEETIVLEGEIEDEEPEADTPLRARVIKMKRSDFEAAVADGSFEEEFDALEEQTLSDDFVEEAEDLPDMSAPEVALSPEDEADLQSELDAVAAELESVAEDPTEDAAPVEEELGSDEVEAPLEEAALDDDEYEDDLEDEDYFEEVIRPKSRLLGESDRSISRLFDETESHLDTPEASRRRSAILHLRAAVEANEAETDAGSELRPDTDDRAYRSDIADVMRTHDSEDAVEAQEPEEHQEVRQRARRPVESRPAPLKLVAEQRVDTSNGPVRPRRVSAAQISEEVELPQGADSFSQFAEDIGANNLSELLEAAAAYMSDVEGRVQFSRPMLMGKLKEAKQEDFSREDSLKSFGQLLRNGKLQKLKGGRFTVTDETDFRAKDRNAS